MKVHIQAQRPTRHSIDITALADTAGTFNNQMRARLRFCNQVFRKEHLSSYSELDLQVLTTCRTQVNNCRLRHVVKARSSNSKRTVLEEELVGIDIRRA